MVFGSILGGSENRALPRTRKSVQPYIIQVRPCCACVVRILTFAARATSPTPPPPDQVVLLLVAYAVRSRPLGMFDTFCPLRHALKPHREYRRGKKQQHWVWCAPMSAKQTINTGVHARPYTIAAQRSPRPCKRRPEPSYSPVSPGFR